MQNASAETTNVSRPMRHAGTSLAANILVAYPALIRKGGIL